MAQKLFSDADFDKSISIGDQLIFDKQDLKTLRIDLSWVGTDLDICAFLLGEDGQIHEKEDLVYCLSKLRWKTKETFDSENFNPLDGRISTWDKDRANYKNETKWMEDTLPISSDGSVIGSWDDMSDSEECGETMHVLLEEVDTRKYASIIFAAAVSKERIKKGETFVDAHNPVVNIFDADTNELLAEYKLAQQFPNEDAVCFGKVAYDSESMLWNFEPTSKGYKGGIQFLAMNVFN